MDEKVEAPQPKLRVPSWWWRVMLALVEESDIIQIDIPGRSLSLDVDDAELARRRAAWTPPEPRVKTGYLARYAKMVTSASTGAILDIRY